MELAVERKEAVVVGGEEQEVPLIPRHPSSRPTAYQPSAASATSSPHSPVTLCDSSDSDDEGACSICLGLPVDPAVLDSCVHSFCFLCIFRWCTDICNNCPLCKRRVTQIKHYGDTGKADGSLSGRSRQAERRNSAAVVKLEERSREEVQRQGDDEADEAADDWALIQTQRAENQMKQAARRRGRRQGGGPLSQLSLDASPTSLVEGIEAIAAIGQSESAPVTRQMVKQKVAEQQQMIGRTQSNGASQYIRPSSLLSLRHSQSNGAICAVSFTTSFPTSASAVPVSASASPPSAASPAVMLVVDIPDRQQRASYEEAEEVPSPSILNIACELCFTDENEHLLLLCDGCDDAYHTYCLLPRLEAIPEQEWFCPTCLYEAHVQLSDEQKDVTSVATPRRSRGRAQRLGLRVSPAIRQRLMVTPQSADSVDADYTPTGRAARFDVTPIPLSFASIRPGYAPRAMQQRRSMRQEQLRRQAVETRRQLQDEQTRLRAERAAKRREGRAQLSEDDDESDDSSASASASAFAVSSAASSRSAADTPPAPPSSLHQLGSSQNDTLQRRIIHIQRMKAREEEKVKEATRQGEEGLIQSILNQVVQQRNKEDGTTDGKKGRRIERTRRSHREDNTEEYDDSGGSGGRVRRKAVNRSRRHVEPIIVHSTSSSRQQADSSSTVHAGPCMPTVNSAVVSATSAAASNRLTHFSASPTSSPPSSLSSLPHPTRSAQVSTVGRSSNITPGTAETSRAANVRVSPSLTPLGSAQPPHAVVPPARFPYTAPAFPKRVTVAPLTSPSNVPPASSPWQTVSSRSPVAASSVSSVSPLEPPLPTFEEFELSRSSRTSRSPFRSSLSPQQQRQPKWTGAVDKRHSISAKTTSPQRRSIFSTDGATHDSEYWL